MSCHVSQCQCHVMSEFSQLHWNEMQFRCHKMLCYVMLCYVMLCYVMLCYVMLCYVMLCYVMLCWNIKPGRYSGSWFALIHWQNVNWITTTQINPRHEKMQISFYINQVHLWNNSMFLESICFVLFCTRFFICIFIFFYLYIFILEMLGKVL